LPYALKKRPRVSGPPPPYRPRPSTPPRPVRRVAHRSGRRQVRASGLPEPPSRVLAATGPRPGSTVAKPLLR